MLDNLVLSCPNRAVAKKLLKRHYDNKKISFTLCLILTHSIAHSGTASYTTSHSYLPFESKKWLIGGQALYLKPDLGSVDVRGLKTLEHGEQEYTIYNPNYQWGFMIEGDYQFATDRDFNLNWYHVESTQHRNFGPIQSVAGDFLSSAYGSINPDWNAVNFEVGQQLNFTNFQAMRLHAGIQYARIALDETRIVVVIKNSLLVNNAAYIQRVFNGFGPRIGADLSQSWQNGLGVYGKIAASMLVGTQSSKINYPALYPGRTISMTAVVPEMELKLGINYSVSVLHGTLKTDAGWMWLNYFNTVLFDNYNLRSRVC